MVIVEKDTSHTLKSIFYPENRKEHLKYDNRHLKTKHLLYINQTFNIKISIDFENILCYTECMFKISS